MKCLSIDTVTESCSVALFDGSEIVQQKEIQPGGHSQLVLGMVHRALADSELALGRLDAIVVDTGPGSFTGVRIGLGVAQGLAYGANLPVIGVSSLETMALSVDYGIVAPAIDARMKQIYCAVYDVRASGRPTRMLAPCVSFPDKIGTQLERAEYGVGSGWDIYADVILGRSENRSMNVRPVKIRYQVFPEAIQGIRLAQRIGIEEAVDPRQLEATYIRNKVTD